MRPPTKDDGCIGGDRASGRDVVAPSSRTTRRQRLGGRRWRLARWRLGRWRLARRWMARRRLGWRLARWRLGLARRRLGLARRLGSRLGLGLGLAGCCCNYCLVGLGSRLGLGRRGMGWRSWLGRRWMGLGSWLGLDLALKLLSANRGVAPGRGTLESAAECRSRQLGR